MKQKLLSFILAVLLALDPGFTVFAKMQDSQETSIAQEEDSGDLTDIAADSDLIDAAAEEEHEDGLELLEEPEYSSGISMAEDMIISSASESESYVSGNYTYTVTDGEATITAYTGSETDVVIPAQIDGINVVEIGDAAFAQNTAIQSVVISNGIKRLGHGIFDECTSLSSITFSKTLEWMGRWNFDGTAIEKIRLDQTSELELDAYAFAGADKLTQIELYGNTTVMSSSTFSSCNALDTVAIGANVSEKYGGDGGLHSCPNLRVITLSDNNTNYTLKDGVLYNEDMTKIFCYPAKKGGTEYIMPNTVEEVPSFTFWYNRYLEKIVFSTNLTTIGNYATSDNYCLSIVEIPASVTSIGNSAFTDLTIWGFKGSAAETYANRYDLAFVDIEEMKDSSGKESTSGSEDSDWNGSKTEAITPIGDTYVVKTAAQLAWIAQETANGNSFACKKILLDADIDLGGNEWTPIGNSNTHFMGSFDGQGHTISNLTVTGSSSKTLCGLFGAISAKHAGINVVIKDINLENVTISGGNYGGGLTGYARIYKGTNLVIEGCTVEGTLNGATVDWDSFEIKAIGMRVTKDGESASEPRTVTIFQEIEDLVVTSVSLNTTYVYLDEAGMQEQLSVKVNPTGVSGVNLVWESSDPTVASVDQNGLVTAKRPGDAIIRVSTEDGGCYSRCVVMVGGEDPGPGIVFEDVASYHFFYYPVLWAVEKGVTDGATDTTFAPDNSCTRGQVVTFLWRAAGKPQPTSTTCNFTDVAKGAYYYDAVLWAVEKGITDGTSDTTFSPDATCTRGQVVTFLWRSAGQPNATADVSAFTDVTAAAYYYNPVRWAVQYGITDGTSDTTFSPDATCTRGQVVTFLYRTYN